MRIYTSAEELIGSTPLLELVHIEKEYHTRAKIFAKLEFFNPTGSAKDRAAKAMLDAAEQSGELKPGGTVIEPTSGNTGIGLAAVAAVRGYRAVIVMPDTMSVERRKLMKAYGAELVLSPGAEGMSGAVKLAEEIRANTPGAIIAGQFDNPANSKAHYETTGPEIYADTDGSVDILIAGVGTGGTLCGTGRYLKEKKPSVRVLGVEPASSPLLSEGKAGPHGIQGIGANFIPKNYDPDVCDGVIAVSDEDAFEFGRAAGKKEGILVGISSGAALCAAVKTACDEKNEGKNIVVILPDTGERYLSSSMFGAEE